MKTYPLPVYLQRFFMERLATQLHASPNTVASYRDTFRLLLRDAAEQLKREPTQLGLEETLFATGGPLELLRMNLAREPSIRGQK